MLSFVAIDPSKATVEVVQAEGLSEAMPLVGLNPGEVDFGTIDRNPDNGETINIVVYEYGMYLPTSEAKYFSMGSHLFVGGAILFAADFMGETVSITKRPPVLFYRDAAEVEKAIAAGVVERPQAMVNGEVVWAWPSTRRPW